MLLIKQKKSRFDGKLWHLFQCFFKKFFPPPSFPPWLQNFLKLKGIMEQWNKAIFSFVLVQFKKQLRTYNTETHRYTNSFQILHFLFFFIDNLKFYGE